MFGKKPESFPLNALANDEMQRRFEVARDNLRGSAALTAENERLRCLLDQLREKNAELMRERLTPEPLVMEHGVDISADALAKAQHFKPWITPSSGDEKIDHVSAAVQARDYKRAFELVQEDLHQTQNQLRMAAIREERVERMVEMIRARGLEITTDSQGNVILSNGRASVLLPTGYGLTEDMVLPKG
jgi:hypothetical protein